MSFSNPKLKTAVLTILVKSLLLFPNRFKSNKKIVGHFFEKEK
jgi:hypothetical protein